MGLASDNGLLIPETIPDVRSRLADWQGLSFVELAQQIMPLFIDDIEPETLKRLVAESYASFDHDDVVGMEQLDDLIILELFHGPTLAFKDVALQLLGSSSSMFGRAWSAAEHSWCDQWRHRQCGYRRRTRPAQR